MSADEPAAAEQPPTRRTTLGLAALGGVGLAGAPGFASADPAGVGRTGLPQEDVVAIHDILARYAWYIDTHQSEKWADLFAPGAKAIFTHSKAETREELLNYTKLRPGQPEQMFQHHVGCVMIDGDPGGQSCSVRSYEISTLYVPGADLHAFLASGVYTDRCIKQNGLWLFMERRFQMFEGSRLVTSAADPATPSDRRL